MEDMAGSIREDMRNLHIEVGGVSHSCGSVGVGGATQTVESWACFLDHSNLFFEEPAHRGEAW
jgi:hypothetical protein